MKIVKNVSGEGVLFEEGDLDGTVFASCSACMALYAEFLSWANANKSRVVKDPDEADNIIVLSCQVTDLAILNDLRTAEKFYNKKVFISGCLARRFDIELPSWVARLDNLKSDGTFIEDKSLIRFEKPFWVEDFKENKSDLTNGNLFRDKYPFRIGVGCSQKCTYCSIRYTRGDPYQLISLDEFSMADNIVLIADSPSVEQVEFWIDKAISLGKRISIRNIEPHVFLKTFESIRKLAESGLLHILHCPVQASSKEVLDDMGRSYRAVCEVLEKIYLLDGVIKATNIIVDYKDYDNDFDDIYRVFDYVSWNPYWDGIWDRSKAEEKFLKYFPWSKK